MKKIIFPYSRLWPALLLCGLWACARQGAPTGGAKDTAPPQVDTLHSTRNFSTNFSQKQLELTFDEWVVLADVPAQVVISPPLVTKRLPDIKLKGKTVVVTFPEAEKLRPNTTYTLNFGSAIKDLHEGNVAKDLRFVFSTGAYIDSLTVQGTVNDAFTGDPVENVAVMLYDNLSDSVVMKEKPYYFARTDKQGQYTIRNVRPGTFKCVAVEDLDQNLKWTGDGERIGFPDSLVVMNDTLQPVLKMTVFKDFSRLRLVDKNVARYGVVRLGYNGIPDTVRPAPDQPGVQFRLERLADSILVWYDFPDNTPWNLIAGKDTVAVKKSSREDFLNNHRLRFQGDAAPPVAAGGGGKGTKGAPQPTTPPVPAPVKGIPTISQNSGRPAFLLFNYPIAAIDTSKWLLTVDTLPSRAFTASLDTTLPRTVQLQVGWKANVSHLITLLPGALTDFYGKTNQDTLQRKFNVFSDKQVGGIQLTVSGLVPGTQYVLQVLNGKNLEEERVFDATAADKKFMFSNLPATQYSLLIVEDRNRNRRWDSGSYLLRRQPEGIGAKKLEPLRANWDMEATLEIGESEKSKPKK